LSPEEAELEAVCASVQAGRVSPHIAHAIERGEDPLGDWFCRLRSPEQRRAQGATYTPAPLIERLLDWARRACQPDRVVDPGCGSGRFLVAAGRAFPRAELVGIDCDPLAAHMARAHLAAARMAGRARVEVADYTRFALPAISGITLFLGNPPYVRHHQLGADKKAWLQRTAGRHGLRASGLSGLHAYFFLATLEHARIGDIGCFVTASEWLDTRYGELIRALLRGPLGLLHLHRLDPTALPFADAMTTAVITGFRVGDTTLRVLIEKNSSRRSVTRSRLAHTRWSELWRSAPRRHAATIELGELCRVHRGQVTGANQVWIHGNDAPPLPLAFLAPTITRAQELFSSHPALRTDLHLRRVVDLPAELDALPTEDRERVALFLRWARTLGADQSYIARHRKPWWSVRLPPPAPILATYMARKKPVFVRNLAGARHLNIAHGLYPRAPLSTKALDALADHLTKTVELAFGRTYAGGLVKFEPREMERLPIPGFDV
jgi:SAM-dependent methyltransferase